MDKKGREGLKLLIKRGKIVDPVGGIGGIMDILIENGKIAVIGSELHDPYAVEIDAKGLMVCAGLVDMHVHLREPGFEYKEDITSGCLAAARGGVTSIAPMPNTKPVIDSPEGIRYILERAAESCGVNVWPIGAVSVGELGEEETNPKALKEAGAVALSDDGVPVMNADLMRNQLMKAHRQGMAILAHSEDINMVRNYAVNEGRVSRQLGIPGRPAIAEEYMIMRDAMLAEETGTAVHICHISTAKGVDIVRRYKKRGVRITCETCPQYFTLTEDEILTKGTLARVNPPLRTSGDVDAIIRGLQDGTIDAIVTDHAPHSEEEKARPLETAPSGMVGLETSLAITLTALYHTGRMSLSDIIRKMTINPANILGIPRGRLAVGCAADITIFDPDERWTIDPAVFVSKGKNTPFGGMQVRGRVKYTIAAGKVIYQDENQD